MGRKANSPDRRRGKRRANAQDGRNGSAPSTNETPSHGAVMTDEDALPAGGSRPHRLFPESVPPAMVAEVFDVAGADDDLVLSSVPPPPERTQSRSQRPWSRPPVPHPPHPQRPSAAPASEEADALELPSDELEEDTPVSAPAAASARGAWFAVGGVALLLGVALGVRSCTAARPGVAPAEPPHATR